MVPGRSCSRGARCPRGWEGGRRPCNTFLSALNLTHSFSVPVCETVCICAVQPHLHHSLCTVPAWGGGGERPQCTDGATPPPAAPASPSSPPAPLWPWRTRQRAERAATARVRIAAGLQLSGGRGQVIPGPYCARGGVAISGGQAPAKVKRVKNLLKIG